MLFGLAMIPIKKEALILCLRAQVLTCLRTHERVHNRELARLISSKRKSADKCSVHTVWTKSMPVRAILGKEEMRERIEKDGSSMWPSGHPHLV